MPTLSALPETCATAIHLLEPLKANLKPTRRWGELLSQFDLADRGFRGLRACGGCFERASRQCGPDRPKPVRRHGVRLSLQRGTGTAFYRLQGRDGSLDTIATICSRPKHGLRALSQSPKETATRHWFGLGGDGFGRIWRGAHLLVRLDVRIFDAISCHASAGRKSPGRNLSPDGFSANQIWRQSSRPWVLPNPPITARSGIHLSYSSFGFKPWPQARLGKHRDCPLCDGIGGDDRFARHRQLRAFDQAGDALLWLV